MFTVKKVSLFFITLAFLLPALFVSAEENISTENSEVDALYKQISSLLSLVESLQKQIMVLGGENSIKSENTFSFGRNLSVGDIGKDVKALQMALNKDERTKIANFGPGAPGFETEYFGGRTATAVSRFQELYSEDILVPVGLSQGNGFVGPSTREKLQKLYGKSDFGLEITKNEEKSNNTAVNKVNIEVSGDSSTSLQTESTIYSGNVEKTKALSDLLSEQDYNLLKDLYESDSSLLQRSFAVGSASSYTGAPGEKIVLDGIHLTNDIDIHFNDHIATGTASEDGTELVFTVPDIDKGPYELTFTNSSGEKALRIMDFAVVVENAIKPEIYSIFPPSGPLGTEITISGVNFAKENNTINFGQRAVEGVPSEDGKTIKVKVVSDIFMHPDVPNPDNANWPIWVYLANENGFAPVPAIFLIKI
jgi:peptidoglycan hydrolase-like protein with peptidoglycan-binding domain